MKKKTIKIGGVVHDIIEDEMLYDNNAMGRWDEIKSRIIIRKTMNKDLKKNVLWHEVIHCVLEAIGESELGRNEDFVDKLAKELNRTAKLKIKKNKVCK